ncbi:MAG TPA: hypothetical protein VFI65_05720 [Streptosporangiaceae bacterium]|nr:hypothetical protein [Streptosporangiaceae bacterium]
MTSLDDDLAAWAATVRLPDTDADAIFRRITTAPPPSPLVKPRVDPTWWRHFTADFTARMVASTRPVRQAA